VPGDAEHPEEVDRPCQYRGSVINRLFIKVQGQGSVMDMTIHTVFRTGARVLSMHYPAALRI
jgi:hypothetical protein